MHFPHKKQAQMRERGKTSIGNEDVPFAQLGVHRGRVTHVMGAHRRGQHPQQQAGSRVKQRQHVSDRKTAPFRLRGRLAKVSPQRRCVRHGEARTVQGPGAMSAPSAGREHLGEQGIADALEQVFEQRQRQALPRLAISRGGERYTGQTRQRRTRGIAMKNLQQEHMHGGHRTQRPITANILQVATDLDNRFRGDCLGDIGLELAHDFGDSEGHPWPPVGKGC